MEFLNSIYKEKNVLVSIQRINVRNMQGDTQEMEGVFKKASVHSNGFYIELEDGTQIEGDILGLNEVSIGGTHFSLYDLNEGGFHQYEDFHNNPNPIKLRKTSGEIEEHFIIMYV